MGSNTHSLIWLCGKHSTIPLQQHVCYPRFSENWLIQLGASVAEWLRRLPLKLLAPLLWGSNPMRGCCQLLMEGCCFTHRHNLFIHLWKMTAIYNQTRLKNTNSPHLTIDWYKEWGMSHLRRGITRYGLGLNSMRGICQLLTEGYWFTPQNN